MKHHPLAQLFPMLPDEQLMELGRDIRDNGQQQAVVLDEDGSVLDGRNRSAACLMVGVEPRCRTFTGTEEQKIAFVVSSNLHRRHLDTSQRSMIAGRIRGIYDEEAKQRQKESGGDRKSQKAKSKSVVENLPQPKKPGKKSRDRAAEQVGVSGKSVDMASKVLRDGTPELASAVDSGEIAVSRAAKVADLPPDKQEEVVTAAKSGVHVSNNSGEVEWYTPSVFVESARVVMGAIDLDPSSNLVANEVVKADSIFTKEDDGLEQDWSGRVWMNPPYAAGLVGRFIEKLCESFTSQQITEACVLVNNATETKWFQRLASESSAICFPKGRIKFWHPDRERATGLQGQAILYFGGDVDGFLDAFNQYGLVVLS